MNSKITNIICFIAGATAGSLVTWKFIKDKYEKLAKDEIDSVVEVFSRKRDWEPAEESDFAEEEDDDNTDEMKEDYKNMVSELGYSKEDESMSKNDCRPYVISPEEFGDDYDTTTLTYYADGVLTDEDDEPIPSEDIDELVGLENLKTFGQYEDDSVFVRDDINKLDIEILRDESKYGDKEV